MFDDFTTEDAIGYVLLGCGIYVTYKVANSAIKKVTKIRTNRQTKKMADINAKPIDLSTLKTVA